MIGTEIYQLARELWPINRSITGNGVRETLQRISKEILNFKTSFHSIFYFSH